jgi:hypothetical protein
MSETSVRGLCQGGHASSPCRKQKDPAMLLSTVYLVTASALFILQTEELLQDLIEIQSTKVFFQNLNESNEACAGGISGAEQV